MDLYQQGLAYVKANGQLVPDRTGKGRHRTAFPPDQTFYMSSGIPLTTAREINPTATIEELLWFISGSNRLDDLKSQFFWKKWALTLEQAKDYCERHRIATDTLAYRLIMDRVGTIGMMYGSLWRNAPSIQFEHAPKRLTLDLPSDIWPKWYAEVVEKLAFPPEGGLEGAVELVKAYEIAKIGWETDVAHPFVRGSLKSEYDTKQNHFLYNSLFEFYWKGYDQLNELIVNIKKNPYSSRHRVTAFFPQYMAFEDRSIPDNICEGRGALTPCHSDYQCFVEPNPNGGRDRISLKLIMSSNDYPVGRIYNITQYSILLCMIAQVCNLEPYKLCVSTGDAHIYGDQMESVDKVLSVIPNALPRLWLNPDIKDLFAFTTDDVKIVDYRPNPPIHVPVSV